MKRLLLIWLMSVSLATTFEALSLEALLEAAELAFYGEVLELSVELREGEPWTLVRFALLAPLRGLEADAEALTLAFYGGETEGISVQVAQMPRFEVGERVVILAYDAPFISPIVGFNQGLWREQPLGLIDEQGQRLSLDDVGALQADGPGASTEALLAALAERLEGP